MAQQLFMDMAAHPQAILDAMDGMRAAIEKIERQQKWITPINILRWTSIILGFILAFILENILVAILLIGIPILSFFFYHPKRFPARARFEAAYQVIHTLRDDAGRKATWSGAWT